MELLGHSRADCAAILRRAAAFQCKTEGPPVSQSGCCGYGLPTFADPVVNGQIAPITVIPLAWV
jgi:hypothetical protein